MKVICVLLGACVLSSCSAIDEVVPSYRVSTEGISGREWESKAYHDIPAHKVRPNVDFRAFGADRGEGDAGDVIVLDEGK